MEIDWNSERKDARAELEAFKRQEKRRDAEPLLLCRLITRWPLRSFLLALFGHVSMLATTGILYASGYDILPLFLDDVPMRMVEEPWDARWYAWNDRNKYPGYYTRGGQGAGYQTSEAWHGVVDLYYEANDGSGIFTKSALLQIKELEDSLMAVNDYRKFCKVDAQTRDCVKPLSVLRYFDGTFIDVSETFNDTTFDNINDVLFEAFTNNLTRDGFRFFLAKGFNISTYASKSHMTRSLFYFGAPHETLNDVDFKAAAEKYSGENLMPILKGFEDKPEFKLSYRSEAMWMFSARKQAMEDVLWAGASMLFIFLVILVHTRSLWISGFAIFSIFLSFLTGNLIYNLVLRFRYVGYFHILSLFIILGIGADNVFVFYDVWRNTGYDEYISLAHRLSDTYRRSVFSMLFTSLTTCVAFLSSAITPLLATRSFGVFSAVVVVVNFCSVIIYFPTVVIVYHIYFEKATWPCCYPCESRQSRKNENLDDQYKSSDPSSRVDTASEADSVGPILGKVNPVYEADGVMNSNWRDMFQSQMLKISRPKLIQNDATNYTYSTGGYRVYELKPSDPRLSSNQNGEAFKDKSENYNRNVNLHVNGNKSESTMSSSGVYFIDQKQTRNRRNLSKRHKKKTLFVQFFRNYYFRFVTHTYVRWLILAILAGVLAFFIYQASKIEPDNELFNILPDDHPFTKALGYKLYAFVSSFEQNDALLSIHLLFGARGNDLSECYFSEPVCTGKLEWDPDFNPNTEEAQKALLNLCEKLRTLPVSKAEELRIQRNSISGKYNVKCFMDNLQAFLQEESALTGENLSVPFTKDTLRNFTANRPEFYNSSLFTEEFGNLLEIPISYWLTNKYTGAYTKDFYVFDSLIGEQVGAYSSPLLSNEVIKYGNNIKFVAITVGTSIQALLLGYKDGDAIKDRWEEFLNTEVSMMPAGLKTAFQTSSHERWVWITRQRLLVLNAVYGIVIGLCLACPILIIATGNIITGLLATLSLCCSTVCVVGVVVVGGWKLGLIEAVNMCMVVGLAVDYVVHLAEGYTLSLHQDRLSRVRDMLDLMGVSVFFGACTTLGASLFMFFTVLTFFQQFGIFLFSTIGFSLLFSMGLFTTLLGIIGPERDQGDVVALFRRFCCRRRATK